MPFEWLCTLHFTCTSEKPCVDFRCLHVCGSKNFFVSFCIDSESFAVKECLKLLISAWIC